MNQKPDLLSLRTGTVKAIPLQVLQVEFVPRHRVYRPSPESDQPPPMGQGDLLDPTALRVEDIESGRVVRGCGALYPETAVGGDPRHAAMTEKRGEILRPLFGLLRPNQSRTFRKGPVPGYLAYTFTTPFLFVFFGHPERVDRDHWTFQTNTIRKDHLYPVRIGICDSEPPAGSHSPLNSRRERGAAGCMVMPPTVVDCRSSREGKNATVSNAEDEGLHRITATESPIRLWV